MTLRSPAPFRPKASRPRASRPLARGRAIPRSGFAYWALALLIAAVTAAVVVRTARGAARLSAEYGPVRTAVVAEHTLEFGHVVGPDDVYVQEMAGAMVPADAPHSEDEVLGRTVVLPAMGGLPLVAAHLAPGRDSGLAALLPTGARGVAVPRTDSSTPVRPGDRVDVLATLDPAAASDMEPTFLVARHALVVQVDEAAATVAVTPEEAKRVAYATVQGAVTLALEGPGEPEPD